MATNKIFKIFSVIKKTLYTVDIMSVTYSWVPSMIVVVKDGTPL